MTRSFKADTTILLVEDEQDLRELLAYNLTREGYRVEAAATGEAGLERAIALGDALSLVLLDLMLPGMDGIDVCTAMKCHKPTAMAKVIMLTARGEEADIVRGLEAGADGYVTKPFSPKVLLARVAAVLRRTDIPTETSETTTPITAGRITIDPARFEVKADKALVPLTATEFKLLTLLARSPGRVFTRQQVIESIHEGFAAVTDRSVDVQVVSLRRKLGEAGEAIETVRGIGYRCRD